MWKSNNNRYVFVNHAIRLLMIDFLILLMMFKKIYESIRFRNNVIIFFRFFQNDRVNFFECFQIIKQLNACLEQKCEQFDHDKNACFKQFVNEIVKTRNFIKDESFDDRKNFRFRNARRTFDRIQIKKLRNVNQIDRWWCWKKDVFKHVNLFFKCVDRAIIELENEHFENFSK
jgi:hypothetical protein